MPYMTEKEIQEMHISMIGYETKNDSLEAENRALREALQRARIYVLIEGADEDIEIIDSALAGGERPK